MRDLTILVTACGAQFMPGLAACLKNNGERNIRIVGTDMEEDRTILQMVDAFYKVPRATDPSYAEKLLEICKTEHVDVVLPFMSADLIPLLDIKEKFEEANIKLSVSDRRSIEITNNKFSFYSFMKEQGLNVPKFARITKSSELCEACVKCGYPKNPVCVKATELSGSRGIRIIDSSKSRFDLLFGQKPNSFYTTIDDLQATLNERDEMPEMMAMEFLPGQEGSVDLLADHGKILYMGYRESNVNLHSIPQVATLRNNPKAYKIAEDVISALGLDGNADLDFKEDGCGNPVLMEVNPRIAATMQIFAVGGMNLPYLRIKQVLGEPLPDIQLKYGVRMKRRYTEMFADC